MVCEVGRSKIIENRSTSSMDVPLLHSVHNVDRIFMKLHLIFYIQLIFSIFFDWFCWGSLLLATCCDNFFWSLTMKLWFSEKIILKLSLTLDNFFKKISYLRKMAPHVGNGSWSFRCCCYSGFVGLNWTPTGNGDRVQLHNGSPGMNPPDQQTLQRMGGHIGVPADPHNRKLTGHLRLPFWGLFFFVYRLKKE